MPQTGGQFLEEAEEFHFGQVECEVVPGCPGRDKAAG